MNRKIFLTNPLDKRRTNLLQLFLFLVAVVSLNACIGDDFIDDFREPELRIVSGLDTIEINSDYQLEVTYLNNVGDPESIVPTWSSSDDATISVSETGLATANAFGEAVLTATYDDGNSILNDEINLIVGMSTVTTSDELSGTVKTTSSYKLSGDFTLAASESNVVLSFDDDYCASTALPGLFIYLSNNSNSIASALEIGAVEVFDGAHEYVIPNVGLNEYSHVLYFCKPFNVKVGDGEIL